MKNIRIKILNSMVGSILLIIISISYPGCQQPKEIAVAPTYDEAIDPNPILTAEWGNVPEGLQASFTTINKRFSRGKVPNIEKETIWTIEAWRGERVNTQLVLWTNDSLVNTEIKISDFKTDDGNEINAQNAHIQFVKYVLTDEFAGGCGYRKPEDFASSLAADALDRVSSYAISANETRAVWITLDIPSNTEAGTYKGTIVVNAQNQNSQFFYLTIKVIDMVLPAVNDWKFHLDLWQNPYAVARYHQIELWSKEHWDLLKPLMERLANAGQKVITVSLNKRPWGGQTYDQFEAMIDWTKRSDDTWDYDYSNFDNWVQFMMDLGVTKQINCFSMVPWGNELYYFDEKVKKEVKVIAPPGTPTYAEIWVPFLKDFKSHLEDKGWNKITRIAMDERGPKEMQAMLEILNKHAPEFGVSFADNHKSYKLYPNELKDMSVAFGHPVDEEDLITRKENGYVSTHYVCCSDKFPNTFTFSEPMEGVFIGWYSIAAKFDGFLRWAYNSWVENPLTDSRFRAWPAGDTYLVYPDNRSSIRFECLRDGIEDAEKIRVLREKLVSANKLEVLGHLNEVVKEFDITSHPGNLEVLIEKGKDVLNRVADDL